MPTPFAEVQFPVDISQGAIGGMGFNTTINEFAGGGESRNVNWAYSKGSWDVSKGLRTQEDVEILIKFFASRRGRAYAFRFKDWTDYRCPRWRNTPGDIEPLPVLFVTNGVTGSFQLFKDYVDSGGSYRRLIRKPVNPAICAPGCYPVALQANNLPISNPANFTVDMTTGIVVLNSAIWSTVGTVISGAFEFDVPCRFDTDHQKLSITTTDIMAWPAIPVVETRDF